MKQKQPEVYRNNTLRKERNTALNKEIGARSIYEHVLFIAVITLICCAVDFYTIKSEWTLLRADDFFFIYGKSLINAFGLDVSLSILAVAQRRYESNMLGSANFRLIAILSLAVFGLALLFELYLAYLTGKYSFTLSSESSTIMIDGQLISSGNDAELSEAEITSVSLINGLTPLLTSIVVYIVSYFSYDPIRKEIYRIKSEIINAEHAAISQEKVIAEINDLNEFYKILIAREETKHQSYMHELDCLEVIREQISLLAAMKLLDPDGISLLKSSAYELNKTLEESDADVRKQAGELSATIEAIAA